MMLKISILLVAVYAPMTWATGLSCEQRLYQRETRPIVRYLDLGSEFGGVEMGYMVQTPLNWNKKSVVLVPGLGRNMRFWNPTAEYLLNQGFRVLRVDPINVGETLMRNRSIARAPTLEMDALALTHVLQAESISQNIYMIGHSRGAAVALLATERMENFGIRVKGLMMTNPFLMWLSDYQKSMNNCSFDGRKDRDEYGFMRMTFNPFNPLCYMQLAIEGAAEGAINKFSVSERGAEAVLQGRKDYERTGFDYSKEVRGVFETLKGMEHESVMRIVHSIEAPIAVVSSPNDLEPRPLLEKFSRSLRKASPVQLLEEGKDHFLPNSNAPRFERILDRFFE